MTEHTRDLSGAIPEMPASFRRRIHSACAALPEPEKRRATRFVPALCAAAAIVLVCILGLRTGDMQPSDIVTIAPANPQEQHTPLSDDGSGDPELSDSGESFAIVPEDEISKSFALVPEITTVPAQTRHCYPGEYCHREDCDRSHTGECPYSCENCGRNHTGKCDYTCANCGKNHTGACDISCGNCGQSHTGACAHKSGCDGNHAGPCATSHTSGCTGTHEGGACVVHSQSSSHHVESHSTPKPTNSSHHGHKSSGHH